MKLTEIVKKTIRVPVKYPIATSLAVLTLTAIVAVQNRVNHFQPTLNNVPPVVWKAGAFHNDSGYDINQDGKLDYAIRYKPVGLGIHEEEAIMPSNTAFFDLQVLYSNERSSKLSTLTNSITSTNYIN